MDESCSELTSGRLIYVHGLSLKLARFLHYEALMADTLAVAGTSARSTAPASSAAPGVQQKLLLNPSRAD